MAAVEPMASGRVGYGVRGHENSDETQLAGLGGAEHGGKGQHHERAQSFPQTTPLRASSAGTKQTLWFKALICPYGSKNWPGKIIKTHLFWKIRRRGRQQQQHHCSCGSTRSVWSHRRLFTQFTLSSSLYSFSSCWFKHGAARGATQTEIQTGHPNLTADAIVTSEEIVIHSSFI